MKRNRAKGVSNSVDYHSCSELETGTYIKLTCDNRERTQSPSSTNFKFPPPPRLRIPASSSASRLPSASALCYQTVSDFETNSDTSQSDSNTEVVKRSSPIPIRGYQSDGSPVQYSIPKTLPPIGVFWDIENCQVPRGRSAVAVAQAIRDKFFSGYREAEFLVVCDVKKENAQVIQELNDAQVNLIHVSSTSKNAADEKLRQSIRRFADIHGSPAAIILISGDINFAADLCDLRHRKKIHVILLHNEVCSENLMLCATENHSFKALTETLPLRGALKNGNQPVEVLVSNLPLGQDAARIRNRLKRLSENCGGRVGLVIDHTTKIRFPSMEFALRAQKRMSQERVFGNRIIISYPELVKEGTPMKVSYNSHNYHSEQKNFKFDRYDNYSGPHRDSILGYNSNFPARSYNNELSAYSHTPAINISNQENVIHNDHDNIWSSNISDNKMSHMPRGRPILAARENTVETEIRTYANYSSSEGDNNLAWQQDSRNQFMNNTLFPMNNETHPNNHQQSITILKRPPNNSVSPSKSVQNILPMKNHQAIDHTPSYPVISINTSIPPPPIINLPRRPSPVNNGSDVNEADRFFHPIGASQQQLNNLNPHYQKSGNSRSSNPVGLHVTNLDPNMDADSLRRILTSLFRQHVQTLHVSVYLQKDGDYAASIKVPSLQDAQFAISKLHRHKVGYRRILISYARSGSPHNPSVIRSQIVALLLEVPGYRLPLFKFSELFEKRYFSSLSVSTLYKMEDVCIITDEPQGRMISLNPNHRNTPSPRFNYSGKESEWPYCQRHWRGDQKSDETGWAEMEASLLPCVKVVFSQFSANIKTLLASHNNKLPLSSLCDCYAAECGVTLEPDENGVPLEHLISCVSGVEIVQSTFKFILPCDPSKNASDDSKSDGHFDSLKCISPSLIPQLSLFSRELADLLKTFPHCRMPFSQFIPAYHHHFGRQCRVADYGYTKLIDLLEILPHVIQVLGGGSHRTLTLAHRVQIRRFTSDLLRVLKAQTHKQCTLSEFPSLFEKLLNRPFDPVDYGLCYLEDLLSQVPDYVVVMTQSETDTIIAIPKREQTPEEIERTKIFAAQAVELLSHAPQCSILFSKFIPAYHHHYGHQCRVSDYGFTKLIDLFDAIPDIVKVVDDSDGERQVTLTTEKKLNVLTDQLLNLINSRNPPSLPMSDLCASFLWQYGYALKPLAYDCQDLGTLLSKLETRIKVIESPSGPILQAVDLKHIRDLAMKVRRVLMEKPSSKMTFDDFCNAFKAYYGEEKCELETLEKELSDVVKVTKSENGTVNVQLRDLQLFARDIYRLLLNWNGRLALSNFEMAYLRMFGTAVQPAQYNHQTLLSLLQAVSHTVLIRGKGPRRILVLNKELANAGILLPSGFSPSHENKNTNERNGFSKNNNQAQSKRQNQNAKEELNNHKNDNEKFNSTLDSSLVTPENSPPFSSRITNNISGDEEIPSIQLPDLMLHPDTFKASKLISPCKSIQLTVANDSPQENRSLNRSVPYVMAPDPSELPMPSMLIPQTGETDEADLSNGSVEEEKKLANVNNSVGSSDVLSSSEDNLSNSTKRKPRVAALFNTPMELK
ncbi:unnamed protein product [Bemisia tabaci]|uniref:HTH OST-type domain-containing protein n=1 Tax=Bemisia tabaci TaxID=7038 RepID=A0A9P0EYI2_BEMTA|nr:unnamed protein product [Bemisia tabaci]